MNFKKIIYIILAMILGVILSFIAHAFIEIFYLSYSFNQRISPEPSSLNSQCYLPSSLQIALFIAGLIGGYFLGRFWWRKVYGENTE